MSDRPLYDVTIAEHVVNGRWPVPASLHRVGGPSLACARATVVRLAHIDAGVPALRSLLRLSWPHARAVQVEVDDERNAP